ncbi:SNF2 family helicase/ATPase [Blastomyces gilchristii SLH14081]|uniref:SNF2 family helicase/ATPase n=1 Tax=Blastomyces gilchristii (strain SLH14081) TaxID=559298 RepID=A0A179UDU2_BLAGS|nr:SNF2 family helicase/ATPase [Blastomyces gilchristii SLH14081]OAT05327.1 SNF2 family helicase/ATPase [Blastomyces gilchristii SLH14081]
MSILKDVAFASGPVPNTLQACFSKLKESGSTQGTPGKRRKLNTGIWDSQNTAAQDIAASMFPEYLTLAHIELKITFSSPALDIHAISSDYEDGTQIKVLISKWYRMASTQPHVKQYKIELETSSSDVILQEILDFHTGNHDLLIPMNLPSIYRTRSSPTALSMSTLRRVEDDQRSFILETKVFWKDTLKLGKRGVWQNAAFSTYLPGALQEHPSQPFRRNDWRQRRIKESTWTPSEFYDSVHVPPKNLDLPPSALADFIECQLFPFQRRAVQWLLQREGVELLPDGRTRERPLPPGSNLPDSFSQIKDADGHICYMSHLFWVLTSDLKGLSSTKTLKGGILAEEMGLGKTVEMITLISLHRRPAPEAGLPILRQWPVLTESGATLIITPSTILDQWKQEISSHAPHLRCTYYEGINRTKKSYEQLVEKLASCDVVLTTYNVLQREIHYAEDPPDRSLRSEKKVIPRKSPLVKISWWRVCIDEAQMIETGVSHAARVARLIPRHNAWAVTGTPLRKDMNDLLGLLSFLRIHPLCDWLDAWVRLYEIHKPLFKEIIGRIVLRHNKDMIRDELNLPRQKRIVITIPFTAVEEQHYDQLFEQMCEECGVDALGAPRTGDWDPNSKSTIETMRRWLTRLRQACLHPEVGGAGRKAFGMSSGPLRSVAEVLEVMIDQNELRIRAEERSLLLSQIRRGQLLENAGQPKEALELWQAALALAEANVRDSRVQLEIERKKEQSAVSEVVQNSSDDEDDVEEGKGEKNTRLTTYRGRLRSALEIQHICKFFIANAYYQIKTNTELTTPDSEEFFALEKLEVENYEAAKLIRKEMLAETDQRVSRSIRQIQANVSSKGLVKIPKMSPRLDISGMESGRLLDKLEDLCEAINKLTQQFIEWRTHSLKLLLEQLVDEEDNNAKLEGDEYESSTQHQDEMYVYMEGLRALFADYHDAITGQKNTLIEYDVKKGLARANDGKGPSPKLYISFMKTRECLKPSDELGSLRGILTELRGLAVSLEWQEARGSTRARAELGIVNRILQDSSQISSEQSKVLSDLEKEVQLFHNVMNRRLEYYRQLQQISDTVAPYDEESRGKPLDIALFDRSLMAEHKIEERISALRSKYRYLIHLRDESGAEESARICVICQSTFEIGVLTVCGHKYCKDCLRFWWRQHRTCPMCKIRLKSNDFHQITYKPTEIVAQEERAAAAHIGSDHSLKNSIYSDISSGVLKEIRNIDVEGSFGTKIDTLGRHLIWLRQHDPGAKSIVFSQYKPFLGILARAFSHFKIGFSSIDSHDGVERFKSDPSIECFLLHAKAHASGLNLINATHVFLCEPLINTAIELQAIARVHRIGQHRETTVWMYLVSDSVEECIYDISVSRRLAHIAQKRKQDGEKFRGEDLEMSVSGGEENGDGGACIETVIEAANSLELQDAKLGNLMAGTAAEGERVPEGDLWQCLFAKTSRRAKSMVDGGNVEAMRNDVDRLLRAEAAEERIADAGDGGNGEVLASGDASAVL